MAPRLPKPGARISFTRTPTKDQTVWTLNRRSQADRRLFIERRTFPNSTPRPVVARELVAMRRRLRDAVDAYDLTRWGIAA